MSVKLENLGRSAALQNLSRTEGPARTVQQCPLLKQGEAGSPQQGTSGGQHEPQWTYEECDIQSMTFMVDGGDAKLTRQLSAKLRNEPVSPSVDADYIRHLSTYDLVVEALGEIDEGRPGAGLEFGIESVPKVTHSNSVIRPHPHNSITGSGNDKQGLGRLTSKSYCPQRSQGLGGLAGIWPFGAARRREVVLKADSCGNLRSGVPVTDLAVLVAVYPAVEWEISVPVPASAFERFNERKRKGWSYSDSRDLAKYDKDTKSFGARQTSHTSYIPGSSGLVRMTGTTTRGRGKEIDKLEMSMVSGGTLAKEHKTIGEVVLNSDEPGAIEEKDDYRKFSVKLKVAGEERECAFGEIINSFLEAKNIFERILALFQSIKVGYSIDAKVEIFEGSFKLGFGNRTPAAYVEENRVYYIERFISLGANCSIVKFSLEIMFGVEIDAWVAGAHAKIYLLTTGEVNLEGNLAPSWTRPTSAAIEGKLGIGGSIGFEVGGSAGYYVGGKSWESKLLLEVKGEVTGEGKLSSKYGLLIGAKIELGKAAIQHVAKDTSKSIAERKNLVKLWEKQTVYDNNDILGMLKT